jgi:LmbE family N-acetylglucosaminyl deacetylase
MLTLSIPHSSDGSLKILCLGAHSDDIEIGCGGAILKLLRDHENVQVHWVVFSGEGERTGEALGSAADFLAATGEKQIVVKDFKGSFFPHSGCEIKEYFEEIKKDFAPDIIFTHYRHDLHQDHRVINELTWNTFRNHFILEYEIVKYDGDIGQPNFFVHLDEDLCRRKIDTILKQFKSQSYRTWFTEDAFYAILRLRGIESNSPGKYSEGFYCRKALI